MSKPGTALFLAMLAVALLFAGCASRDANPGRAPPKVFADNATFCPVEETTPGCLPAQNQTADTNSSSLPTAANGTLNSTGEPAGANTSSTFQTNSSQPANTNQPSHPISTNASAEPPPQNTSNSTAIALALSTGTGVQNASPLGEGKTINGSYANFIAKLKAEVLPTDADNVRPYLWKNKSVRLDSMGFNALLEMDSAINLSSLPEYKQAIYTKLVGVDEAGKPIIDHPCCAAPVGECGCGHALANKGLAKFLLQEGWGEDEILKEELMWNKLFFPNFYLQKALDEKVKTGELEYAVAANIKNDVGGC